jgi:hypothetical protein
VNRVEAGERKNKAEYDWRNAPPRIGLNQGHLRTGFGSPKGNENPSGPTLAPSELAGGTLASCGPAIGLALDVRAPAAHAAKGIELLGLSCRPDGLSAPAASCGTLPGDGARSLTTAQAIASTPRLTAAQSITRTPCLTTAQAIAGAACLATAEAAEVLCRGRRCSPIAEILLTCGGIDRPRPCGVMGRCHLL